MGLEDYHYSAADWRAVLNTNKRRTRAVMISFVLIYVALGLLMDLYWNSRLYPQAPLPAILNALLTFKIVPYATFITTGIAIISLWVTFAFHDSLMLLGTEYTEVTPAETDLKLKQLYNVVEEMKVAAGLSFIPKIYVIDADYMNAFASGYSEKSAMVAITRGLLEKLDRAELTAVMAHELSHIRHGDIKLTLMASVLANLMVIMVDVLFFSVLFSGGDRRDSNREGGNNALMIAIVILRYLLPLVTVLLMLYLSRRREYMADAGCVELMRDNEPLGRALLKIQSDHEANHDVYNAAYQATPHEAVRREAYIFDPILAGIEAQGSLSDAFSTHPGIADRLKALGFIAKGE